MESDPLIPLEYLKFGIGIRFTVYTCACVVHCPILCGS